MMGALDQLVFHGGTHLTLTSTLNFNTNESHPTMTIILNLLTLLITGRRKVQNHSETNLFLINHSNSHPPLILVIRSVIQDMGLGSSDVDSSPQLF